MSRDILYGAQSYTKGSRTRLLFFGLLAVALALVISLGSLAEPAEAVV